MSSYPENKTCDICLKTSDTENDVVTFGDWMARSGITVHYFCLLLSSNLPQRGGDTAGILGFLVSDIRKEINRAKKRKCMYCQQAQASIACHVCKKFFHLGCGNCYGALFQFSGEFRSYCDQCTPLDNEMLRKKWPLDADERCYICQDHIDNDSPIKCIRARCCGNGFVHRQCLRQYALASGYYLRCIWCGSKEFRDFVRTQGIFVPDRDAQWEREKNAYAELHKGHSRCNMETCCCPKGRDYSGGRWNIIVCSLCGSFGAHNPNCLPCNKTKKQKVTEFKCEICQNTSKSVCNRTAIQESYPDQASPCIINSLQMRKIASTEIINTPSETLQFSEDTLSPSSASIEIEKQLKFQNNINNTISKQVNTQTLVANCIKPVSIEKLPSMVFTETPRNETVQLSDKETLVSSTALAISKRQADLQKSTKRNGNHSADWSLQTAAVSCVHPELDNQKLIADSDKVNEKVSDELEKSLENPVLNMDINLRQQSEDHQHNIKRSHVRDTMYLAKVDPAIETKNANQNSLDPDIVIIEGWPEIDDEFNCTGTWKVRIDMISPRFFGKSIDDIIGDMSLISYTDKFERTNDRGIFEIADHFIAEEIDKLENIQKCGWEMAEAEGNDGHAAKTSDPINEEHAKESSESKNNDEADKLETGDICMLELKQNVCNKFKNHSERKPINSTNSKQANDRLSQMPTVIQQFPEPDNQESIVDIDLSSQNDNASQKLEQLKEKEVLNMNKNLRRLSAGDETKKFHQNEMNPDITIIEGWPEFDDEFNCTGTWKVRIDMNSPRFVGKTLNDICGNLSLVSNKDKFERNNDRNIIEIADHFIAEEMAKLKNIKKRAGEITESEEKGEDAGEFSEFTSVENDIAESSEFTNVEEDASETLKPTKTKDAEVISEPTHKEEDSNELKAVKSLTICTQELGQAVDGKLNSPSEQSAAEHNLTPVNKNSLMVSECDDNTDLIAIEEWPDFDDNGNCIGMATVRINLNSPRFSGKTVEDILATDRALITDADKVYRTDDIGIFRQIDAIIAQFKNPEN